MPSAFQKDLIMRTAKGSGLVLALASIQLFAFACASEKNSNEQDMFEYKLAKKELLMDETLELMEKRAGSSSSLGSFDVKLLRINDGTKMTIGAVGGEGIVKKLKPGIDPDILNRMAIEAQPCEGGQKEFFEISQAEIRRCFINSSEAKGKDLSYLEAFRYLSSLVDTRFDHKCIISVFAEGVWITAGHCIPKEYMKFDLAILVDGRFVGLKPDSVRWCSSVNCDIAFISMKTPLGVKSGIPKPVNTSKGDYWNTEIIIPGLQQGKNLAGLRDHDKYANELLWSSVGHAFCRIITDSDNGCIVHGCSTLVGFSGAPLYKKARAESGYELAGIHSGTNLSKEAADTDGQCDAGINVNYASRMKGEGF